MIDVAFTHSHWSDPSPRLSLWALVALECKAVPYHDSDPLIGYISLKCMGMGIMGYVEDIRLMMMMMMCTRLQLSISCFYFILLISC